MGKTGKILVRVLAGTADANIAFGELTHLLAALGFKSRTKGSHHIFWREGVAEILNLQEREGKAKPYQVRQVRDVIVKYRLGEDIDG
jgi:hypothetical protein